jgi:hypothetical protein
MSHKKALALSVMLIALAAVFAGINYVNAYTSQTIRRTPVLTESIVVPPMGYGYIPADLNASADNYFISINSNGTIRRDFVLESVYQAWANGSHKPSWNEFGPATDNYAPISFNTYPEPVYFIFWNTNAAASVEVTFKVCQQWTEPVYNNFNLGFGILLTAVGAVLGLGASYSVSKRVLLVVIALTLIVSGVFLAITYSQMFYSEEKAAAFSLAVPAGACVSEHISDNATGFYVLILEVDRGSMNSTVLSEEVFAEFSKGQYEPYWLAWRGHYSMSGSFGTSLEPAYLVLSNPQALDKQVNVEVHRYWEDYNYAGLIGGILLIATGAGTFYFANRTQIASFNKALENQEDTNISSA